MPTTLKGLNSDALRWEVEQFAQNLLACEDVSLKAAHQAIEVDALAQPNKRLATSFFEQVFEERGLKPDEWEESPEVGKALQPATAEPPQPLALKDLDVDGLSERIFAFAEELIACRATTLLRVKWATTERVTSKNGETLVNRCASAMMRAVVGLVR